MNTACVLRLATAIPLVALAVACGGKTAGNSSTAGSGGGGSSDGGNAIHAVQTQQSGQQCIDVTLLPGGTTCSSDDDCGLVETGILCPSACSCPGVAANTAALSAYGSATATLPPYAGSAPPCECPAVSFSRCNRGVCTLCTNPGFEGVGSAPVCPSEDAGATTDDAGSPPDDAGVGADASECLDIPASQFDQSCSTADDCLLVQTGEICSTGCNCPNSYISKTAQEAYESATSSAPISAEACPCVGFAPLCSEGKCLWASGLPDAG